MKFIFYFLFSNKTIKMSHNIFQHYIFDTDLIPEPSINYQNNSETMLNHLQSQLQLLQLQQLSTLNLNSLTFTSITLNILSISPWTPSPKFLKLLDKFNSTILNQFICATCAFCDRLMYPEKCKWLPYNESLPYPLLQAYSEKDPKLLLTFHVNVPKCVAICLSCKNPHRRYAFPFLHPIPDKIQVVPLENRMYLSPVFIHCSLGRNSGHSAMYTEYKTLIGTMNFSKNMHSLILYSGMIGAYLEDNSITTTHNSWLNDTLIEAANWLK